MLFAGGLLLGGVYAFARQRRWFGAGVLAVAAVIAFAAALAWSSA